MKLIIFYPKELWILIRTIFRLGFKSKNEDSCNLNANKKIEW